MKRRTAAFKEGPGVIAFRMFNVTFMLMLMFVTLYPMIYVLFASLSDGGDFMRHTGMLFRPLSPTMAAYKSVFRDPMIIRGYANTIFVVIAGVALNIFMTSITAYALSRQGMYWQKLVMSFITLTMVLRGGTIPRYVTIGIMYNMERSMLALIIPQAISTFNLIIMKTAFSAIPVSLEESAKLDGAGHLKILASIVLPLSLPVLAVMVLYYSVAHWNSWFDAVLFLRDREMYPLQLILREVLINSENKSMLAGSGDYEGLSETVKYAAIVVTIVPILMVYPFLQKYFVKGTLIGAVKG